MTIWPICAGRLRSKDIWAKAIDMCPAVSQHLSDNAVDEYTSDTVASECEALCAQVVLVAIADDMVQNAISLLELEGKLFLRRWSVVREHDRSLTLPRYVFHQRCKRGRA